MADNVTITAGTGTSVATDDVSGAHYQRVKLGVGVADSAVMLGHLEDAAHTSGDGGFMVLVVRADTAASTAGSDGDYCALVSDSTGRLHVNVGNTVTVAAHAVTNAGTFAVQATCTNAGTFAVQAAQSGTWTVTGAGGTFPVTDSAGSLTVDAPVGTPVFVRLSDGAAAIATLPVSLASVPSHAVTNAGTFAVQVDGAALTSLQLIDDAVSGAGFNITQMNGVNVTMGNGASGTGVQRVTVANDSTGILAGVTTVTTVTTVATLTGGGAAHDGVDSGNPHKIGMRAISSPKGVTLVAAADRTDIFADLDGIPIVKLNTSGADAISERVSNTDGTSTAFSNFSAVASTKNAITAISAFRTDTGTTMAYIDFRDGTAGSILWSVPLPPAGGANISQGGMPLFKTSANTALAFDVSGALTTIYISVSGFQTKV